MTDATLTTSRQTAQVAAPTQTPTVAARATSEDTLTITDGHVVRVSDGGRMTRVGIDVAAGGMLTLAHGGTITLSGTD